MSAFLLCQLAPHGCEDSAAIEISAFRRISGGADMCRFPGLKKVLRQKTSKQNPEGSRRENRKNEKQIVAASYAARISAANQVTQLESKPRSKPQIKVDAKLPATNYYGRKNLSGYQPQLFRAQREIVVLMPRRCAGWNA